MTEGKDKNHSGQNLPDKKLRTKLPEQNPRELNQTPCKDICMHACATKNRGSEMCDVLYGVPRCVTKCDRKWGIKIGPK